MGTTSRSVSVRPNFVSNGSNLISQLMAPNSCRTQAIRLKVTTLMVNISHSEKHQHTRFCNVNLRTYCFQCVIFGHPGLQSARTECLSLLQYNVWLLFIYIRLKYFKHLCAIRPFAHWLARVSLGDVQWSC